MLRKALLALGLSLLAGPAHAATFVPPGGDWRTLETTHFRIHFRSELRDIARKVAEFAEESHAKLGPYFGRESDVTHVTILDSMDTTNGFGTPYPEASLTFFLTPPSPDEEWYVGRYDNWLKMIMAHEYVHVLQARAGSGPGGIPGYINSAGVRAFLPELAPLLSLDFLPDFMKEGLAVYQESAISGGGRALEGYYDMVLRCQYQSGNLLTIDQSSGKYDLDWAPGGGRYVYGTAFYTYLAQKYGEDAAPKLTERLGEVPWAGINIASQRALGKSTYDLWTEAIEFYRDRYKRQIQTISAQPLTKTKAITSSGRNHRHPRWLDNDTLMYTRSPMEGGAGLVKGPVTGDDPEAGASLLLAKSSRKDYSLSGDRRFLYYYAEGDGPRLAQFADLYRFDLKRGTAEPFTRGQRATFPAVSPDGERVLAVLGGNARKDLGMFDRTGKLLWRFRGPDFGSFASPIWSPDGKRVALVQWLDGRTNVVLFEPETRTLQPAAPEDAVQLYPAFSPDGKTLFFATDRSGVFNVHALNLGDGKRFRLTNVLGGAFDPAPSPDGKQIAFVEYGPAGYDIRLMPLDPATWLPEGAQNLEARGHFLGGDLVALGAGRSAISASSAGKTAGTDDKIAAAAAAPDRVPSSALVKLTAEQLDAVRGAPEGPYNPLTTLQPQLIWPYFVLDTSQFANLSLALPSNLATNLAGAGPWLSLRAYGQDTLRQHTYLGLAGLMVGTRQPIAALSYWNDQLDPTVGLAMGFFPMAFGKNPDGALVQRNEQSFTFSLSYPPPDSVLLKGWQTGTVGTAAFRSRTYGTNTPTYFALESTPPVNLKPDHFPASGLALLQSGSGVVPLMRGFPNQLNSVVLSVSGNGAERPGVRPFTPSGGPLWTVGVERADRALGSELDFTRAWADLRYFIPTFGRQVLAVRAVGGTGYPDRQVADTVLGGLGFTEGRVQTNAAGQVIPGSGGIIEILSNPRSFILGETLQNAGGLALGRAAGVAIHDFDDLRGLPGEVADNLPLRGYSLGAPYPGRPEPLKDADFAGIGNHGALLSAEYRIPLFEVQRGFGTAPLFVDRVSLAPFVEVGKAWNVFDQSIPLWSAGLELRTHVTLAQYLPTQVRLGYARGLSGDLGVNQVVLGIGAAF